MSIRPGASLDISGANFGSVRGRVIFRLKTGDAPTVGAATTSWSPRIEPGTISRWAGRSPTTIEQPDPRGVSWAKCI